MAQDEDSKLNKNYGRPINNGQAIQYAPKVLASCPYGDPTEADYNREDWYLISITPPKIPEGKALASVTYEVVAFRLRAYYRYKPQPMAHRGAKSSPRYFQRIKLYSELLKRSCWDSFVKELDSLSYDGLNAHTAFQLSQDQDITETSPIFVRCILPALHSIDLNEADIACILEASAVN